MVVQNTRLLEQPCTTEKAIIYKGLFISTYDMNHIWEVVFLFHMGLRKEQQQPIPTEISPIT